MRTISAMVAPDRLAQGFPVAGHVAGEAAVRRALAPVVGFDVHLGEQLFGRHAGVEVVRSTPQPLGVEPPRERLVAVLELRLAVADRGRVEAQLVQLLGGMFASLVARERAQVEVVVLRCEYRNASR